MQKFILILLIAFLMGCSQKSPEDHLSAAKQHILKNEDSAALIELKNTITLAPKNAEARFILGEVYIKLKDFLSAEKELNKALSFGYPNKDVLPLLTYVMSKNKSDIALSNRNIIEKGLSDTAAAKVAYFKLEALIRLNDLDKARRLVRITSRYKTDSPYKALVLAYGLAIDQKLEDALMAIYAVLAVSAEHPEGLLQKASLLVQLERKKDAAITYETYIQLYPDDLDTAFALVSLLIELKQTDQAEPHINQLLIHFPENEKLNYFKALIAYNNENYDTAFKHGVIAFKSNNNALPNSLISGYSAYVLKDYEAAIQYLGPIAIKVSNDHAALKVLVKSQIALGLNIDAASTLVRFDSLSQDDIGLLASTSIELLKTGDLLQAKELIQMIPSDQNIAEELKLIGLLQLSINSGDAIKTLEKSVGINASMEDANTALAIAYIDAARIDDAEQLVKKWIVLSPQSKNAHLLSGIINSTQGNDATAAKEFSRVLEIAPNDKEAQVQLIKLTVKNGNVDAALQEISAMLVKFPLYIPAKSLYFTLMHQKGRTDEALVTLKSSYLANKGNSALTLLYAKGLLVANQNETMISLLEDNSPTVKNQEQYNELFGLGLLRMGDIKKAGLFYQQWWVMNPTSKNALSGKLAILAAQNKNDLALTLIDNASKTLGTSNFILGKKALFLLRMGLFDEAILSYDKLSKPAKNSPEGRGLLSKILVNQGELQRALPHAIVAYDNDPSAFNVRTIVAIHERLSQQSEARSFVIAHMKKHPNDQITKIILAEHLLVTDRIAAIRTYEELISVNSKNFVALNNLAFLYKEQGKLDKAEEFAIQAVSMAPDQLDARVTLSRVLLKKGELRQAITHLAKISAADYPREDVRLDYVEALLEIDNVRLAKREIGRLTLKNYDSIARLAKIKDKYKISLN